MKPFPSSWRWPAALAVAMLLSSPALAQDRPAAAAAISGQATPVAPTAQEEAVRAAVLDYVEALYEVEPDRIRRSVAPQLSKYGFVASRDAAAAGAAMSFDDLVALAARWNSAGRVREGAPKTIEVFDIGERIASAKLTAHWGVDYLLLTRDEDGRWRIRQVLWEAPSRVPASR